MGNQGETGKQENRKMEESRNWGRVGKRGETGTRGNNGHTHTPISPIFHRFSHLYSLAVVSPFSTTGDGARRSGRPATEAQAEFNIVKCENTTLHQPGGTVPLSKAQTTMGYPI